MNSSLTTILRRAATTGFVAAGIVVAGAAAAHAESQAGSDGPVPASHDAGPASTSPLRLTLDLGSTPRVGVDLDAGVVSVGLDTGAPEAVATPIPAPAPHPAPAPRAPRSGPVPTPAPKATPHPTPAPLPQHVPVRTAGHRGAGRGVSATHATTHTATRTTAHSNADTAAHAATPGATQPASPSDHPETDWYPTAAENAARATTAAPSTVLSAKSYPVDGPVSLPLPAGTYTDLHNFWSISSLRSGPHTGTDLSAPCGTPVLAANAGTVVIETDQPWAGRWLVKVMSAEGALTTWYAHMQALTVAPGQRVRPGDQIGQVGALGNATGCHLHFEVHPTGGGIYEDPINPSDWLATYAGKAAGKAAAQQASRPAPYSVPQGAVGQTRAPHSAALELPSLLRGGDADQSAGRPTGPEASE